MIILSKEQVLKLHAGLIKATGGSDGIRDEGMLDLWRKCTKAENKKRIQAAARLSKRNR